MNDCKLVRQCILIAMRNFDARTPRHSRTPVLGKYKILTFLVILVHFTVYFDWNDII